MIFESAKRVHLTRSELNDLRQKAARNGRSVNEVRTPGELLRAVLDSLPPERQVDLLAFLERAAQHRSPTRPGDAET